MNKINPLDGMMSQKRDLVAQYDLKWQQWCRRLGFFGDDFYMENLHFRGQNFGE